MRRPILPTVAVALALVLAVPAGAAEKVTERDRFRLWNDCRPMELVVEDLSKDAAAIGLTTEAITVAVRSRLRAARLYLSNDGLPFFSVSVNVGRAAVSIQVGYLKLLLDSASGEVSGAVTWRSGVAGTHGRDASFIRSAVVGQVDKFIDEYLRVNADACGNSN
ncbi:MAG: hypothetical protein OYH76_24440 [Defluviicoccus sp.]|nr:hypothetical protein [Defluviicoccus sp.]MDE0279058.1 hypothetical protein [Defluviicoccus sp.]